MTGLTENNTSVHETRKGTNMLLYNINYIYLSINHKFSKVDFNDFVENQPYYDKIRIH